MIYASYSRLRFCGIAFHQFNSTNRPTREPDFYSTCSVCHLSNLSIRRRAPESRRESATSKKRKARKWPFECCGCRSQREKIPLNCSLNLPYKQITIICLASSSFISRSHFLQFTARRERKAKTEMEKGENGRKHRDFHLNECTAVHSFSIFLAAMLGAARRCSALRTPP